MQFDTKIAVVVREDLAMWQKLNVTAFTISGLTQLDSVMGKSYVDASNLEYLPMLGQPVLVFKAPSHKIATIHNRILNRGVHHTIYTEELFATSHDDANRAAVKAVATGDLNLVGLAMHGDRKMVDKVVKGLKLHD